jgi:hypothetical protein
MILSEEQINCVKNWVADGASISDVQKRLKDEFSIVMTYMDTRFLIDDLDAELVSAPDTQEEIVSDISAEQSPIVDDNAMPNYDDAYPTESPTDAQPEEYPQPEYPEEAQSQTAPNVKVSVSPIQRPDCIVSGDVVFSDGSSAEWRIDRMGQLGIVPSNPSMNPPQEEIIEFQRQLQALLSQQGMY